MKNLLLLLTLLVTPLGLAETLKCKYTNHDSSKGVVTIKIQQTKVDLEFKSMNISTGQCTVNMTATDITAECEEANNTVGIMFELVDGKFQGILMSEKAQVFAQADC